MNVLFYIKYKDWKEPVWLIFVGYLCIIGIGLWGYLSGEYTENQGKLNLRQLISARSGSNASVLTMAGVLSEGSQYTDYLTLYTLFI